MLVRKHSAMRQIVIEHNRGGEGKHHICHILDPAENPAEMNGKGKMFADTFLEPGSSVGVHEHKGDTEAYYFLEGKGLYTEDGKTCEVEAGDVTLVQDGHCHGIKNIGETPLRFIALILKS